jgi:hypothetical protein
MDIAAAYAAGGNANQDFARPGLRLREISHFELQIFFEEK